MAMIHLSLMKAWFDAIDEERRSPIAEQIAASWFDSDASAVVRCGPVSSNIVCRVTANGSTFYLRCNHESERTGDDYAAEMAFVEHLAAKVMRVARPVPSRDGALVERVSTPLGAFHAVVLEAAEGTQRNLTDMAEPSLHAWGRLMAELHNAAEDYRDARRPSWLEHLVFVGDLIPGVEQAAHRELSSATSALSGLSTDAASFGLIHFDMEVDNMRWQDGVPTIFDCDDCAHYWFAADVAFALRDLYQDRIERIDLEDKRLRAFVEGYRAERSLVESHLHLWRQSYERGAAVGHKSDGSPYPKERPASANAAMSLHATPEDFARFVRQFLDSETGQAGLSGSDIAAMLTPQISIADTLAWGLGWGLQRRADEEVFWHWGDNPGFKNFVAAKRKERSPVVVVANSDNGAAPWAPIATPFAASWQRRSYPGTPCSTRVPRVSPPPRCSPLSAIFRIGGRRAATRSPSCIVRSPLAATRGAVPSSPRQCAHGALPDRRARNEHEPGS